MEFAKNEKTEAPKLIANHLNKKSQMGLVLESLAVDDKFFLLKV
jgi:hypothetical protein